MALLTGHFAHFQKPGWDYVQACGVIQAGDSASNCFAIEFISEQEKQLSQILFNEVNYGMPNDRFSFNKAFAIKHGFVELNTVKTLIERNDYQDWMEDLWQMSVGYSPMNVKPIRDLLFRDWQNVKRVIDKPLTKRYLQVGPNNASQILKKCYIPQPTTPPSAGDGQNVQKPTYSNWGAF